LERPIFLERRLQGENGHTSLADTGGCLFCVCGLLDRCAINPSVWSVYTLATGTEKAGESAISQKIAGNQEFSP